VTFCKSLNFFKCRLSSSAVILKSILGNVDENHSDVLSAGRGGLRWAKSLLIGRTRAARLAAIEAGTSTALDIPEELEGNSSFALINRGKAWLIRFLQEHWTSQGCCLWHLTEHRRLICAVDPGLRALSECHFGRFLGPPPSGRATD
jgi:hypothetical protein